MSEATPKKRIFQIAKELNISHKDIIEYLKEEGIAVGSLNAPIEFEVYEKILNEFSKEKQQIERFRKEQARKVVVDTRRNVDVGKDGESTSGDLQDAKPKKETSGKPLTDLKANIDREQKRLDDDRKKREEEVEKIRLEAEQIQAEKDRLIADEAKKKEDENRPRLKILRRPDKEEKEKIAADAIAAIEAKKKPAKPEPKPEPKSVTEEQPAKKRKLKKIDVSTIADKISKSRPSRTKEEAEAEKSRKSALHPPLPKFGKKTSRKRTRKADRQVAPIEEMEGIRKAIKIPEYTTVDELARTMNVPVNDVIKVCLGVGMMVTINQRLDMETIILIADEFEVDVDLTVDVGEEITKDVETDEDLSNATPRPPVVTIMGHVDHGKTSLLDYIRQENVVAGESGGITQHIGAYAVTLDGGSRLTFLDTPGHAAFTAMRARGANITDIVVVVIAADDGVMPQTIEALDHAKAAGAPIIIAFNKTDLPDSDIEKIKRELSEQSVLVEDWGGKIQSAEISAKTGHGIDVLLEMILLEAEVLDLKANKDTQARGAVIESRLDKGLGAVASVLIQKGTLNPGDIFICGSQYSKVRAILNERNQKIKVAYPSDPVQILGFSDVPKAGELFIVMDDEREARKISLQRSQLEREAEQRRFRHLTLEQIGKQIAEGEVQNLEIIIKGDVDGSIEALSDSLMGLSTKEVAVNIIHRSVGMITEADVSLASASRAIILAFHVTASPEAKSLAKIESVEIRHYTIIYEAVNEVKLALEGLLKPKEVEEKLGVAEVRAVFRVGRKEAIAGSYIQMGKAIRNAKLRIVRDGEMLHEGNLTSLKRFKNDVTEVKEGFECGISVDGFNEFVEGDLIEFYEIKEVKRVLA